MASNSAVNLVIGATLSATFLGTTGRAQSHITRLGESLASLRREQRRLTGGRLSGIGQGALVTQEVGQIMQKIDQLEARKKRLEKSFERMSSGKEMMGSALKSVGALWAGSQIFLQPIQAASAFEDAMLGVAKQLEGARDAHGNLTPDFFKMKAAIQAMGREIPMATKDIAEMTAAGLRMGVAGDKVLDFVKTSAKMATAFELPAGNLAENMGKIAGIYQIPIGEIEGLADTINFLDDNAISKGGDIINVLQRIGGTASMLGMSAKDAAALGSTFLTLGASAEVAATASNAVMRELSTAASQGKDFKAALGKDGLNLGLTAEQLQKAMSIDSTGTIMMVLRDMANLSKEKRLTVATKMFGKEYGDDIAKLAGGLDEYTKQVRLANSEEAKGSMQREADAKKQTLSAQWQLVRNQAQEAMVVIGEQLMPVAREGVLTISDALRSVSTFARENGDRLQFVFKQASRLIGAFVAVKTAMFGLGAARYVIGSVASGWGMFRENLTRAADALDVNNVKTRQNIGLWKRAGVEAKGGLSDVWRIAKGLLGMLVRNRGKLLLAAVGYALVSKWGTILSFFQEHFPVIGGLLAKASEWFSGLGDSALEMGASLLMATPLLAAPVSRLGALGSGLQTLGGKFVSLGKLVMGHPLLLAVGLLATAAFLVYRNWAPIKAFFTELWDGIMLKVGDGVDWAMTKFGELRAWLAGWVDASVAMFGALKEGVGAVFAWISEKLEAIMGGIRKASAWIEEKTAPVQKGYWSLRGGLTDGIEGLVNTVTGRERVRADAPVQPRRLPTLPHLAGRAQQNSVTINVTQQPGESGEALAQRIAQAQARALAVQNRGGLYDHAIVY